MEHGLTGVGIAVEHRAEAGAGIAALGRKQARPAHHSAHQHVVPGGQVVHRTDVRAGHHEHVHRRLRVEVLEGHEVVVLEHDRGRDLARRDSTEEAAHGPEYRARLRGVDVTNRSGRVS